MTFQDTIAQTDEPTFPIPRGENPLHPPAEYTQFRAEEPAKKVRMWDDRNAWIFTRWNDVRELLASPHFSAMPSKSGYPFLTPARAAAVKSYQTFITMDPPDHTKFRRMLTKDFTQKRISELRPSVEKLVDQMLDDLLKKGPPADLVKEFALKLPVTILSIMVGISYEDTPKLEQWSIDKLNLTNDAAVTKKAAEEMFAFFDKLVADREAISGPSDNLLGRLVEEQIRPGHLSRLDAVHMLNLLYFAGHETTANQIALMTLSFMMNPDQRAALDKDPAMLKNAIEEMLRFHTITHYNCCRVATADVTIGGNEVKAGEGVYALVSAANRDPSVFDNPDQIDIERKNADAHMTFGYGIHQCVGQPLARLELDVVFSKLFKRIPTLKLAVPFEQLNFKREMYVYGLHSLPVTW